MEPARCVLKTKRATETGEHFLAPRVKGFLVGLEAHCAVDVNDRDKVESRGEDRETFLAVGAPRKDVFSLSLCGK